MNIPSSGGGFDLPRRLACSHATKQNLLLECDELGMGLVLVLHVKMLPSSTLDQLLGLLQLQQLSCFITSIADSTQ